MQTLKSCVLTDEYKHVCFKDLEGYMNVDNFIDLLKGYCEIDLQKIKTILGIGDTIYVDKKIRDYSPNPVAGGAVAAALREKVNVDALSKVAITGEYADLKNKPCTLPNPEVLVIEGKRNGQSKQWVYDGSEPIRVYLPTKLSDLTNDIKMITAEDVEDMIHIKTISVNGEIIKPNKCKNVDIFVPTKLSQLKNDANYVKELQLSASIADLKKYFNTEISVYSYSIDEKIEKAFKTIKEQFTDITKKFTSLKSDFDTLYKSIDAKVEKLISNKLQDLYDKDKALYGITDRLWEKLAVVERDITQLRTEISSELHQVRNDISNMNLKISTLVEQLNDCCGKPSGCTPSINNVQVTPKEAFIGEDVTLTWTVLNADCSSENKSYTEKANESGIIKSGTVTGTYIVKKKVNDFRCKDSDKWNVEIIQKKINNSWVDSEVKYLSIAEKNSADCGYTTRWTEVSDDYTCDSFNKYKKLIEEAFINNEWKPTGKSKKGNLIESNSSDCGYSHEDTQWILTEETECSGSNKVKVEKEQKWNKDTETWEDTGNTRASTTVVEANSPDCGYNELYISNTSSEKALADKIANITYTINPEGTSVNVIESTESGKEITNKDIKIENQEITTFVHSLNNWEVNEIN